MSCASYSSVAWNMKLPRPTSAKPCARHSHERRSENVRQQRGASETYCPTHEISQRQARLQHQVDAVPGVGEGDDIGEGVGGLGNVPTKLVVCLERRVRFRTIPGIAESHAGCPRTLLTSHQSKVAVTGPQNAVSHISWV